MDTLLLWLTQLLHQPKLQFFATGFLSVLLGALPFLVVAVLASAFLEVFVPRETLARLIPKNPVLGILLAPLIGMIIPMCECGIVPVARRLIRKGVPVPVAIAFMLSNPILNPLVILSTRLAFPNMPSIVLWRLGLGYGVAILTALLLALIAPRLVGKVLREPEPVYIPLHDNGLPVIGGGQADHAHEHDHSHLPLGEKLRHLLSHASDEFFSVGRYFILGATLASLVQVTVQRSFLETVGHGPILSVLTMLVLAYILSVCSEADAFVAASFASTFAPGAILAFLVAGPMTDVKNTLMMLSVFQRRFVLALNMILLGLVLLGTFVVNLYL